MTNDAAMEQSSDELRQALESMTVEPERADSDYAVSIAGDSFEAASVVPISRASAVDSVRRADAIVAYGYEDFRMFVATRRIRTKRHDFLVLVVGREEDARRLIDAAYRLYLADDELEGLAISPSAAFQAFLERYAMPYRSRETGALVRFLPVVVAPLTGPQIDVVGALGLVVEPDRDFAFNVSVKIEPGRGVVMAWPFVVDAIAYRGDVAIRRTRLPGAISDPGAGGQGVPTMPSSEQFERDEGTVTFRYTLPVPLTDPPPERLTIARGESPSGRAWIRFDVDPELDLHFVRGGKGIETRDVAVNLAPLRGSRRLQMYGVWSSEEFRVHVGDADAPGDLLAGAL